MDLIYLAITALFFLASGWLLNLMKSL